MLTASELKGLASIFRICPNDRPNTVFAKTFVKWMSIFMIAALSFMAVQLWMLSR